jgi:hypothetical protein
VCGSQRDGAVPFRNLFDRTVGEETDAVRLTNRGNSSKVLQRMESRLPGITKHVAAFTSLERNADQSMDRRADFLHRFQFLIDDIGRHAVALKEVPIQPPEVAGDLFVRLDLLDPVDGGGLAFLE